MQSCVSASRDSLGDSWLQAYLTAPIWRFWLGADICGATVVGALMSSLDGVGRYYPLTLFACADQDDAIAPPDIDAHDEWFAAAEDFLLSTLDKNVTFEAITNALDQLAAPTHQPTGSPPAGMSIPSSGVIASRWAIGHFPISLRCFAPPIIPVFMLRRAFGGPSVAATISRSDFVAGVCLTRCCSRAC